MALSVSDFLGIDSENFASTGALDAILDVDSRLFIDPHLLTSTQVPELQGAHQKITTRFENIMKLLVQSQQVDDLWWRAAARLVNFGEINGLCIGYSSKKISGSGFGPELRRRVLSTAKSILDVGIDDPEIFELIGLLEEGIGADRVSDMIARIIVDDLILYSKRVFSEFGVRPGSGNHKTHSAGLPRNPFNGTPIILVPMDVLRDLPVAYDWTQIDYVVSFNEEVRAKVNQIIGETWRDASQKIPKAELKKFLLENPELIRELLEAYKKKGRVGYDFQRDPRGQIIWYAETRKAVADNPLRLQLSQSPSPDEVLSVVLAICAKFKDLVENNNLSRLLYDGSKPKHEEAAQLVFYGIADSYCEANNLDLTREANAGRGPIDFKVAGGYRSRVLVEAKLSTNGRLHHGFDKQITEYQKAEKTAYSVFLVIDVGGSRERLAQLQEIVVERAAVGQRIPELIVVDAKPKLPASKFI